jgi:cbb3-type cytochrome oxidase subunit 3
MIKDVLEFSANSLWPQISLIIFVICFAAILIWTYRGRKDRFHYDAHLPLNDGTVQNENVETLKELR